MADRCCKIFPHSRVWQSCSIVKGAVVGESSTTDEGCKAIVSHTSPNSQGTPNLRWLSKVSRTLRLQNLYIVAFIKQKICCLFLLILLLLLLMFLLLFFCCIFAIANVPLYCCFFVCVIAALLEFLLLLLLMLQMCHHCFSK